MKKTYFKSTGNNAIILTIGLLLLTILSCKEEMQEDQPAFDRTAMLENYSSQVIQPAYQSSLNSMNQLWAAFEEFEISADKNSLQLLRTAYLNAYKAWQNINLFEFGPAEMAALKSNLNAYPVNQERIEANIKNGNYDLNQLQNKGAKGFPCLDYLLYSDESAVILSAFTTAENSDKRMTFLKDILQDILGQLTPVVQAWGIGGNYASQFIAQKGTDAGSGLGLVVNSLNKHLESDFRDGKLGIPMGVRSSGIPLPDHLEAFYAGISAELIQENFNAIENLYLGRNTEGVNGVGLDDHLVGVDAADLNESIISRFSSVRAELLQLDRPLDEMIEQNDPILSSLYSEIQKLLVLLKVDLPSRLSVLISYQDNDGD